MGLASWELRPLDPEQGLAQEMSVNLGEWLDARQERRFPLERV